MFGANGQNMQEQQRQNINSDQGPSPRGLFLIVVVVVDVYQHVSRSNFHVFIYGPCIHACMRCPVQSYIAEGNNDWVWDFRLKIGLQCRRCVLCMYLCACVHVYIYSFFSLSAFSLSLRSLTLYFFFYLLAACNSSPKQFSSYGECIQFACMRYYNSRKTGIVSRAYSMTTAMTCMCIGRISEVCMCCARNKVETIRWNVYIYGRA